MEGDPQGSELLARPIPRLHPPLDARVEETDDSADRWRKEKVSFTAAYGGERVTAYLLMPRSGRPPYPLVVFFPGSNALQQRSS